MGRCEPTTAASRPGLLITVVIKTSLNVSGEMSNPADMLEVVLNPLRPVRFSLLLYCVYFCFSVPNKTISISISNIERLNSSHMNGTDPAHCGPAPSAALAAGHQRSSSPVASRWMSWRQQPTRQRTPTATHQSGLAYDGSDAPAVFALAVLKSVEVVVSLTLISKL